ncbi:helix-turn-helix domain-containing protein [Paenibacillus filicis]|uniref:Helix-turn-helix domain-containing protein n=1 Tax=Paenibacillus filicis TaxID=669464 RepID=A0ABU9DUG9_9BACL
MEERNRLSRQGSRVRDMSCLYRYKDAYEERLLAGDPDFRWWTDTYVLLTVSKGKGELFIDGKKWLIHQEAVIFCNPDRMLELRSLPMHDLVIHLVCFQRLLEGEMEDERVVYRETREPWYADGLLPQESPYRILMLAQELVKLRGHAPEKDAMLRHKLLYELLQLLQSSRGSMPGQPDPWIQAVIEHMEQSYREDITREAMAAMAGFHPRVFSVLFRKETGLGFAEYLADIRIKKAKEQLLLSSHTLDEIARDVGYSNGLYLSRKFKQVTGLSPSAYAREPKRIVVYDWVGSLLALGIRPVRASYPFGLDSYYLLKEELAGVPDVGRQSAKPLLELAPELIIIPSWLAPQLVRQLQRVAPILLLPYGDPFDRFRQLAEILGREEEARAFTARYEEEAGQARAELIGVLGPDETVGLYEVSRNGVWLLNEFHGRGGYNLYKSLGLSPPASIRSDVLGRGTVRQIPIERLPEYAADHMVVTVQDGDREAEKLLAHPIWETLPAYRHGRIYRIDKLLYYPSDVLSLIRQLPLQKRMFLDRLVY